MHQLLHFPFCPRSRAIRLVLGELGIAHQTAEFRPWEWAAELVAVNPAGELPVLILDGPLSGSELDDDDGPVYERAQPGPIRLCGSYAIAEYLAAEILVHPKGALPIPLFPGASVLQAETRRLVDWFQGKLGPEVTAPLLEAAVVPLFRRDGQPPPDADVLRAAHANLAYHMGYIGWLADQRSWLAGPELSYADLAAAGHLSCLDYLGEIEWARYPIVKSWYQRLKSRRCFQPLLADRVPGRPPVAHYAELDF